MILVIIILEVLLVSCAAYNFYQGIKAQGEYKIHYWHNQVVSLLSGIFLLLLAILINMGHSW